MNDLYDETNIKVLTHNEVQEQITFARIQSLADQYSTSPEWIKRGIECCALVGLNEDHFIERYLIKNPDIPPNLVFQEEFKTVLANHHQTK